MGIPERRERYFMERRDNIIRRKWIAVVLVFLCLMALCHPASVNAIDVPKVTFENVRNESPDLFIKKQVKTGMDGYDVPEDQEFLFILKLNGELAKRQAYRVFDEIGEEVFTYDIWGNRKAFQTGRSGEFSLLAGQTAMFEYVGQGVTYEVTEQQIEDYIQILPEGGAAATGTVQPSGALVNFTNLYLPKSAADTSNLIVRKSISFPEGYEIPETPYFSFQLKLDGKVYSHEKYEIRDMKTDEFLEEKMTDSEGKFLLKGGCMAVFRKIPTDIDYLVEEFQVDGWNITGDALAEGTVTAPATIVNYNNRNAAFAVSKEVEGEKDCLKEFEFLLTRADRSVWAGAPYYLYRTTDGKLEEVQMKTTEDNGTFLLKSGQTAIFCGAKKGEIVNIMEKADPDYEQILPANPGGYKEKMVADGVEILPFINKKTLNKGILSVSKNVENVKSMAAFAEDEFHFILYRRNTDEGQQEGYEPVGNALYTLHTGEAEVTGQTKEDGSFSIKANETARFQGLRYGEYKVEETDLSVEYVAKDAVLSQEGFLTEDGLEFTFVNLYLCKELDLYLTKKNRDEALLFGAAFMLYRDAELRNPIREEPFISGEDGTLCMPNLQAGTYYLAEIRSPEGYRLLGKPIKIDIVRKGANMKVSVDDNPTGTGAAGQIYTKIYANQDDEVYLTVYNSRNFLLPVTGGKGVIWIVTIVVIGVLTSIWSYIRWNSHMDARTLKRNQKRKRRKRQW